MTFDDDEYTFVNIKDILLYYFSSILLNSNLLSFDDFEVLSIFF